LYIDWDNTVTFNPQFGLNISGDLPKGGIKIPDYGNYGGPLNYGGPTGTGVDDLDNLFKIHDEKLIPFAMDGIQNEERPLLIEPHVELISSISDLDARNGLEDPEAILYAGLTNLALTAELATITGGLEALGSNVDIPTMLTQAVENMEEGLAEVPGEGKSLNGALHWFEKHFVEDLVELLTPPASSDIWA
jgi:hypothetical protein